MHKSKNNHKSYCILWCSLADFCTIYCARLVSFIFILQKKTGIMGET